MSNKVIGNSRWFSALFGLAAIVFVGMIISFPAQAFSASLSGLKVWWDYVFPALLPFFILSEIMLGLGVVHAIGVLLEPLMRLLLRLPGAGGWALALSFTSGFPSGAKAAADLRRQGAISSREGNRLLAVSHICSPVFLTGVVAVGFWGRAELGLPLIIIHLVSALLTGLIVAWIIAPAPPAAADAAGKSTAVQETQPRRRRNPPLLLRMQDSMVKAQRLDGRALGRMLGEAVGSSVQSLLVIGGFMIVFSVLLQLLAVAGLTGWLQYAVQMLLSPIGMPPRLADGAVAGLFEVHLGAYGITRADDAGVWGAAMLSAIVAWGGFSVHAQVKSLIAGTDLRYTSFLAARALHSALSIITAILLWKPLQLWLSPSADAIADSGARSVFLSLSGGHIPGTRYVFLPALQQFGSCLALMALFLSASILLSLLVRVFLPQRLFYSGRN